MISFSDFLPFGKLDGGVLQITESFTVDCECECTAGCTVLSILSAYYGECAPKIRFSMTVSGQEKPFYESHTYRIGKKAEYTRREWRVPPAFLPNMRLSVNIDIPDGTELFIKAFGAAPDFPRCELSAGLRHNAHLGFWGLAPNNTMPAFELAAACGFPACIAVPKVTADGVLVCIHDDTINNTATDKDGKAPEEPIYVWDKTYDELCKWEYGSYKNPIYKGTRLPLLSEFFDLCAKVGMIPMFSTHPGLTVEQWTQVKEMLSKRGLLKKFHVKSFHVDILQTAYSVLGTDIDGYTFDVGRCQPSSIDALLNSGIDVKACRLGIEVDFRHYTQEVAKAIRDAGFFAAAWNVKRRDFDEYEQLISWGVTEFTEDYHCSMGLNY